MKGDEMKDTSGLPSNMTKFSGLTEEELAKSTREDLDRIWASIKRLGIEVRVIKLVL